MKNPSLPTVVWWRSRSQPSSNEAQHLVEGYGMQALVPACYIGVISAFEQARIMARLETIFSRSTDRWFIAPICTGCHRRFADLNDTELEKEPDFEML